MIEMKDVALRIYLLYSDQKEELAPNIFFWQSNQLFPPPAKDSKFSFSFNSPLKCTKYIA